MHNNLILKDSHPKAYDPIAEFATGLHSPGRQARTVAMYLWWQHYPDSKVHGANMGPTWVLSVPDGPHVGPMNLAIWVCQPVPYTAVKSAMSRVLRRRKLLNYHHRKPQYHQSLAIQVHPQSNPPPPLPPPPHTQIHHRSNRPDPAPTPQHTHTQTHHRSNRPHPAPTPHPSYIWKRWYAMQLFIIEHGIWDDSSEWVKTTHVISTLRWII